MAVGPSVTRPRPRFARPSVRKFIDGVRGGQHLPTGRRRIAFSLSFQFGFFRIFCCGGVRLHRKQLRGTHRSLIGRKLERKHKTKNQTVSGFESRKEKRTKQKKAQSYLICAAVLCRVGFVTTVSLSDNNGRFVPNSRALFFCPNDRGRTALKIDDNKKAVGSDWFRVLQQQSVATVAKSCFVLMDDLPCRFRRARSSIEDDFH